MSEADTSKRARSPASTEGQPPEKKVHLATLPTAVGGDEEAALNETSAPAASTSTSASTSATTSAAAAPAATELNEEDALNDASAPAQSKSTSIASHNQHKPKGQVKSDKKAAQRAKYKHDHFAEKRAGGGWGGGAGDRNAEAAAAMARRAALGGEAAEGEAGGEGKGEGEGKKRLSKKKVALIIGYVSRPQLTDHIMGTRRWLWTLADV